MFLNPKNLISFFCLLLLFGCSSNKNKTVGDLVEHFRQSKLEGMYSPKFASFIGASEGGSYEGEGFDVEIYKFDDESKAKSLQQTGMRGDPCYANGCFVTIIYSGKEKILSAFQKF